MTPQICFSFFQITSFLVSCTSDHAFLFFPNLVLDYVFCHPYFVSLRSSLFNFLYLFLYVNTSTFFSLTCSSIFLLYLNLSYFLSLPGMLFQILLHREYSTLKYSTAHQRYHLFLWNTSIYFYF